MSKLIVDMDAALNTAAAQADLDKFRDDAKRNPVNERVKLDTGDTKAQLLALKTQLDKTIGNYKGTVSLDGKKALADAAKLNVQLDRELGKVGVDVDIRGDRAVAQMAALDATVSAMADKAGKDSGDKFGDKFGKAVKDKLDNAPWWTGLAAAIPVVSAIGGAALAASVGLAGMAVAGGAAAGVFASVAIPVLTQAKTAATAVATAQAAYNTAIQNGTSPAAAYATEQKAISAAYAGMSPQQIDLSKSLGDMASGWTAVEKASAPLVSGALVPWVASVNSLMKDVQPIIADTAPVVKDLGQSFDTMVNSQFFQKFATWVGQVGSKSLLSAGNGLIGFVAGIVKLLPQFTPLVTDAGNALSRWGTSFDKWAGSKSARDDVQKFMTWFSDNGKQVGSLLSSVGGALKALAPGFGPAGSMELKLVTDFFNFIAKLPPSIAKPLTEVSLVLLTLNKLGVVSVGVKIIGAAAGWIKSLITGGTVDIGAAGMQTAGDTMITAAAAMQKAADTMVGADTELGAEGTVAGGEIAAGGASMGTKFMGVVGPALGIALAGYLGQQGLAKLFPAPKIGPRNPNSPSDVNAANTQKLLTQPGSPGAASWDITGFLTNDKGQLNSLKTDWDNLFGGGSSTAAMQASLKAVTTDLNVYTKAIQKYGLTSPQAEKAAENLTNAQEQQGTDAKTAAAKTLDYGNAVAAAAAKADAAKQDAANYSAALEQAKGKTTDLTISTADGLYNALLSAGKTSTSAKQQIEAMAVSEGFNKQQADLLANSLVTQANKADNLTKSQQTLVSVLGTAENQGKLTTAQTDLLSAAIVTNKGHVDDSKASFDHFANSLGISTTKANALWGQLKNVAGDYAANVKVNVSGGGTVSATVKVAAGDIAGAVSQSATVAQKVAAAAQSGKLPAAAAGAWITGNHSNTDSVPIMAKPGELIVPPSHAAAVANHLASGGYKVPGFASGGLISASNSFAQAPSVGTSLSAIAEPGYAAKVGDQTASAVVAALTSGLKSAQQAAQEAAMGGPNGGPLGPAGAGEMANGAAIFKYLESYAHMTPIAAAGAIASIWGESTWNPMAAGTGGRGLIGWTPAGTISNAAYEGGLSTQLPMIIRFISTSGDWGVISEMNRATSVLQAANEWGKGVERYGINDVHPEGLALATSIMNSNGKSTPAQGEANAIARAAQTHTAGGMISEPVLGFGVNSGTPYSFAENGPEYVGPLSGQDTNNFAQPMTQSQGQANNQLLQSILTALTQQPFNLARAINGGASAGMRSNR